jgi:Lipid A 3-O-deacylase (PagL)
MKKATLLLIFTLWLFSTHAQSTKGVSIEANTFVGTIVRHSKRLVIPPTKNTIGAEIHANWQLSGQKQWHEWQGFPSVGASLLYLDLGEPKAIGSAIGVFPTIDFTLLKFRNYPLSIKSQIGTGIAYLTRHFDQFDNTAYNAVGSSVNCMIHLKLRGEVQLTPKLKVHAGGAFTHFSNGGARLPNFGVNIPSAEMGARWLLDTDSSRCKREGVLIRHHLPSTSLKKWGVNTVAGMALSSNNSRGPKYPIYNLSIAGVRHLSRISRLGLGIAYEQNRLLAEFGLHANLFSSAAEARRASERWMVFLEKESLFGNVAMVFQSGVYFQKYDGVRNLWYNKVGLRIYLPEIGRPKTQFHVGFALKAHLATAEYIAFTGGASF